MEIRKVVLHELDAVLALIDRYDRPVSPRPTAEATAQILARIEAAGGIVVGAFVTGQLIGTCTINLCANLSWSGRPYAMIENVIVAPEQRGKGVGTAVLKFAQVFAEQAGCYKVALMTGSQQPETLRFYEQAGFVANKTAFQRRFGA